MSTRNTKRYYDSVTPTDELKDSAIKAIKKQRNQLATLKLVLRCIGSASGCFLLALAVNALIPFVKPESAPPDAASIFGNVSGYVIAGGLFTILIVIFIIMYCKKK